MLCVSHVAFGVWRLQNNPAQFVEDVKIRIIQPVVLQKDKWQPGNESKIFDSYIALSTASKDPVTHYIWPESAFPFILTQRRDALAAIANMLPKDSYLITGAMRIEAGLGSKDDLRVFNSVYVINHKGEIAGAADKLHLVPFGEYLPFADLAKKLGLQEITGIDGGFTPAISRRILSTQTAGNFLPLICYEIVFPGKILPVGEGKSERTKPQWIVNVTNDAWFGKTSGPYQHHRQAVVRGVEEGLPVIRAANSGISSVSDAFGRIEIKLSLGEIGFIDSKLPKPAQMTLYQIYRNYIFFFIVAGFFLITLRRKTT